MTNHEREIDPADSENKLSEDKPTKPKCKSAHSDNGNANCTGVCQLKKDHSGSHEDQFGDLY